jgi:hypothetical protein
MQLVTRPHFGAPIATPTFPRREKKIRERKNSRSVSAANLCSDPPATEKNLITAEIPVCALLYEMLADIKKQAGRPGTDVMILKIFSPKNWRLGLKTKLNYSKI